MFVVDIVRLKIVLITLYGSIQTLIISDRLSNVKYIFLTTTTAITFFDQNLSIEKQFFSLIASDNDR